MSRAQLRHFQRSVAPISRATLRRHAAEKQLRACATAASPSVAVAGGRAEACQLAMTTSAVMDGTPWAPCHA